MNKYRVGKSVAVGYIVLQPLMLQNPLKPIFPGGLGALQLSDVLFPAMLVWMAWWFLEQLKTRQWAPLIAQRSILSISVFFLATCLMSGIASGHIPSFGDFAKYAYLIGLMLFFVLVLNSETEIVFIFQIVVYTSLVYMILSLAFYAEAFISGGSNSFAHVRNDFPYFSRVVRLIGPMKPTAKMFGAYILFLSLLLMLGKDLLNRKVWVLSIVLVFVCGLLTLGRVGAAAAAAIVLGVCSLSSNRERWLALFAVPILVIGIIIQALTILHFDTFEAVAKCDKDYTIQRQTAYFGWYNEPKMCEASVSTNITYSSYFLLKLLAIDTWKKEPIFGAGIEQFDDAWRGAVDSNKVPTYFRERTFTDAQSTYLTLLSEMGMVGFFAWFALVGLFLAKAWRCLCGNSDKQWVFTTWLICFTYSMIDLDFQNFRFLYFLMPLVAALGIRPAKLSKEARRDLA